jgi:GT2 family glycosyltransferase
MNGIAVKSGAIRKAPRSKRGVSVVMVVFMTGGEALDESVACALADPLVDELVVVVNGCSDDEAQRLQAAAQRDVRVVLLEGHGNIGFARGANLGARQAQGEVLVFLNPDAFVQPGCIKALTEEIEGHPVPCIVGGRVLNADRTEQRGARRGDITPVNALMSLVGLSKSKSMKRFEVHWEEDASPDRAAAVPTISGACFCMRREDFECVGGFDEGYFLHVEDVDLCWRVRDKGGEVLFHPKAEVVHLGHTSLASPLKVEFHKGVGLARFFRKRARSGGQRAMAWALSPLVVAAAVVRPLVWRLTNRA